MLRVMLAPVETIAGTDVLPEGFLTIEENEFDPGSFSGVVPELAGQLKDDAHRGGGIISPRESSAGVELGIDVGTKQAVDLIFGGGPKPGDEVDETQLLPKGGYPPGEGLGSDGPSDLFQLVRDVGTCILEGGRLGGAGAKGEDFAGVGVGRTRARTGAVGGEVGFVFPATRKEAAHDWSGEQGEKGKTEPAVHGVAPRGTYRSSVDTPRTSRSRPRSSLP